MVKYASLSVLFLILVMSSTLLIDKDLLQLQPVHAQNLNSITLSQPNSADPANATNPLAGNVTKFTSNSSISVTKTGPAAFKPPSPISPSIVSGGGIEEQEPLEANLSVVNKAKRASEAPTSIHPPAVSTGQKIIGMNISSIIHSNASSNVTPAINATTSSAIQPETLSEVTGFEGRNQVQSGGGRPPDPTIAAGPNHVIQMVNSAIQISDKTGHLLKKGTLAAFFNVTEIGAKCNPCDPFMLYDKSTDRFFASVLNLPDSSVRVVVTKTNDTQTNDPMSKWNTYTFKFSPTGNECPDQPYIAASSDKFLVSSNVFSNHCIRGSSTFLGTQHIVIPKADLINGIPIPRFVVSPLNPDDFSNRPAKSFGTEEKIILASVQAGVNIHDGSPIRSVIVTKISGTFPNVTSQIVSVPLDNPLNVPVDATQPGSFMIPTTGRLQSAAMDPNNTRVWLTSMYSCQPAGIGENRTCIRIIQIDTNTNQELQDFPLSGGPDTDVFYPAVTVTQSGNLVVTFGGSSNTVKPSLFATGQILGVPPNTIASRILLKNGSASDITEDPIRYGDYFGASIGADPTDPSSAWITGEYMIQQNIWGTFIAKVEIR